MDYIRNRRLQNAISQITDGMNILDAAVMSGYETHTGFLKAFKKAYGITPKKIKNNGGFGAKATKSEGLFVVSQ
jgi:AraC family transcriptional regulator